MSSVIENYEDLKRYNKNLCKYDKVANIKINSVSYTKNTALISGGSDISDKPSEINIDALMDSYAHPSTFHLTGKVDRLKDYDYTKFAFYTEPKTFLRQLKSYINNLILMGENTFTLWGFEIEVDSKDIIIKTYNNPKAETVYIPSFITKIGESAFKSMVKLKKVQFQDGSKLSSIETAAFRYCYELHEINLPSGIKEIGESAFGVTNLNNIIIPDSIEEIKNSTFIYCKHLKNVKLSKNLKAIENGAFRHCSLKNIEFPDTLLKIGNGAFDSNDFKAVTIPNSVIKMGESVFANCHYLKEITIGKGLKRIPRGLCNGCTQLRHVDIQGDIEEIGRFAFAATSLKELILPKSFEKYFFTHEMKAPLEIVQKKIAPDSKLTSVKFK